MSALSVVRALSVVLLSCSAAGAQPDGRTAREQLSWVMEQLVASPPDAASALRSRFTPAFREAVSAELLAAQLAATQTGMIGSGPLVLERVDGESTPTSIAALVRSEATGTPLRVSVVVTPEGEIAGMNMTPVAVGGKLGVETWSDLDGILASLPGEASLAAMRVEGDGLDMVHAYRPEARLAVGSTFKLYVLGALGRLVDEGEATWDETLAIDESLKSLPSGRMQDEAAGTSFPLSQYAALMISLSDNTATDHLMHRIGRERIEAYMSERVDDPDRTLPFLTTMEMFSVKLSGDRALLERFAAAGTEERRAMLEAEVAEASPKPLLASSWAKPLYIEEVEWFLTTPEACRVMADVVRLGREQAPLAQSLRLNPGMAFMLSDWPDIAYKGGSEPGVVNFTWFLEREDGARFALSMTWNDAERAVDIGRFLELAAEAVGLLRAHGSEMRMDE